MSSPRITWRRNTSTPTSAPATGEAAVPALRHLTPLPDPRRRTAYPPGRPRDDRASGLTAGAPYVHPTFHLELPVPPAPPLASASVAFRNFPPILPLMTDDTATIRSTLEDLTGLPVPVHGWDIREGLDSTDDPAVWIWAVIDEDDFDGETSLQVTDAVQAAVRLAVPHLWPYVSVRGRHEQSPVS